MTSEMTMNLRGLKCPLPALRVRKKLSSLKSGDRIVAECTDPLTAIDIPNLLRETGDTLEGKAEDGSLLTFRIRKK
jgi:tRNA 2-thiouridine synthesizing protein A